MRQKTYIKRNILPILFLILFIANLLVFLFRDRFAYFPQGSYSSLYSSCDEHCINKWKEYFYDYPADNLPEAKKIADSAIRTDAKKTIDQILQLSAFLYSRFNNQLGRPTENLLAASPLDQYKMLCKDTSAELWCGNFANMFAYFCWTKDIPCRSIEIMNPGDHHVVNECYISQSNQWVMVDITTNQLLTWNANHQLLNVLDFKKALEDSSGLIVSRVSGNMIKNDTIKSKSYYIQSFYKKENPLYYYYHINNNAVYKPSLKLRRYLLPVSWYTVIDEKKHNNVPFFIKQFLLGLMAASALLLLIVKIRQRITRKLP